jgi:hypothetical protein
LWIKEEEGRMYQPHITLPRMRKCGDERNKLLSTLALILFLWFVQDIP